MANLCILTVNQTASAIPKTWRKPNEGISAGDTPQREEEVRAEAASSQCKMTRETEEAIPCSFIFKQLVFRFGARLQSVIGVGH